MTNSIGARIRYLRKILGLQQEDLAAALFIKRAYVSQIETGKQEPSETLIALIASKFNISKKWLITGEEPIRTELDNRLKKEKARYALETGIGLETVGKRIRFARLYREMPASQLNAMLATKDDYLFALESGKKEPTDHDIQVISRNVGASEEWLRIGEGPIYFFEKGGLFSPMDNAIFMKETLIKYEADMQEPELNEIIQGIKLFWKQSDEDIRAWFKVHFRRTFPEIEECQKKQAGAKDEHAATGA